MHVTLDDIRAAAEAKYGSYTIQLDSTTSITLRNAMRLPKKERDALGELQKRINDAEDINDIDALIEAVKDALSVIAQEKPLAERLIAEIGDDLPILMQIFAAWSEATMGPEASPSAS